jgi:hypothetical protein
MAEIPASTPSHDAAAAQTRRGTPGRRASGRGSSPPVAFVFGEFLLPPENAPTRRRRTASDPLYRPLHIFALDPAQPQLDGKVAVVKVPWEPLEPGPKGRLFEVETVDPTQKTVEAVDLENPRILLNGGVRPTTSDGRFHRQMVYAVCSSVYDAFYRALGRDLSWGFRVRDRLLLRPFAFDDKNAFYDPAAGELNFGYFTRTFSQTASDTIYTSLSHDIVAHELTHALLDGLRRNFTLPTNPDVLAFHEAFGDLVAIFHHFSYPEIVRAAIRDSRGDLGMQTILSGIARQFGEGLGMPGVLRTAIDFRDGVPQTKYGAVSEPHERGAVLVAAVFDTFTRVFKRKTERVVRLAGGDRLDLSHDLQIMLADEASKIASQFLDICVRAVDYCPPVDITFGEFLRAVITADRDLVPDDPWAYREAWLDAFRLREIFPDNVRHMSEDAIEWKPPGTEVVIPELNFAALSFSGDPAHVVSRDETARQANALGNRICRPELLADFGLLAPDGDRIETPRIESIRSSRRIGPDGQIAFDLVAEVTQCRIVERDGKVFPFYGGSTIIIGPDGEVRYVIGKNVKDGPRLDAQAAFVNDGNELWLLDGRASAR